MVVSEVVSVSMDSEFVSIVSEFVSEYVVARVWKKKDLA